MNGSVSENRVGECGINIYGAPAAIGFTPYSIFSNNAAIAAGDKVAADVKRPVDGFY